MTKTPDRGAANLRPWKPGQSGNPSGRSPIVRELRDLARTHTVAALETLVQIMRDENAPPAARIAAAAHLLDRGYGKPVATVDAVVRDAKNLSDAELLAILGQTADEPAETEH